MQSLHFRAASSEDAHALVAVHDACREADQLMDGLCFEYLPTLDSYRKQLTNTDPNDWIVVQSGSEVVGYGNVLSSWAEQNTRQVYLHLGWIKPSARGQGIGRKLLSRLEARCLEKSRQDGTLGNAEFAANASSTEGAAQRLLRATDYSTVYTAIEMRFTPNQPLCVSPLPPDLTLRPVLAEHYGAIWQCIGDAYYVYGSDHWGRQVATEDNYRRYFHSASADPSLWFVAWEPTRIAGVVLCRIQNNIADVYEVSVSHWHRRKGVAKALLSAALAELLARSVDVIRINTWLENPTEAWRLYENVGFRTIKEFPRWRKPFPTTPPEGHN